MRKIFLIIFSIFIFLIFLKPAFAENRNIYFFYSKTCPHCAEEEKFLEKMEKKYPELNIKKYEVSSNIENVNLLRQVGKNLNINVSGVPVLVIGKEGVVGYFNEETTGRRIEDLIKSYLNKEKCFDIVYNVLNNTQVDIKKCEHGCNESDRECLHDCGCEKDSVKSGEGAQKIKIPFLGEKNIKDFSLPVLTIIVGALDGFNPCAMWVLIFLISLILGMHDRKKMWILGIVFIFTSSFVYFLFLSAWLNLFLFINFVNQTRYIIAIIALISGSYYIREFFINKNAACKITKGEKQQKILSRLREIVSSKNFLFSFFGIIVLAVAVNLVELACSAGLPAIYTQVLALSNLSTYQYYSYILLYILFFMLDDMIIFIFAMMTLKVVSINTKYSHWSHIIGGIIMFIIGVLLIFQPNWLMFG